MLDFLLISTRSTKRGSMEIYPKFIIKKSSDLMIRGGDFYAIWVEERGLWSTDEHDALQLIDKALNEYVEKNGHKFESSIRVLYMWDAESGMIDAWHKYCQRQMRDYYHMLDEKLIFSNKETTKQDYASKKLSYPLGPGSTTSYDRLMSVLYSEEERHKIEWAIGSIISGDSKKIQKFMVLYGAGGTGKSTILNIIQDLFEGYYSVFDARALGSSSNSFALESFKTNPLVAIQHDGDLSKIEDNTRLNSLVSHELMTVNEKFKSTYANSFKSFLFLGTNKPVKITDAKSGLMRRLIDVSPTGNKIENKEYNTIIKQIPFELGAIAYNCQEVYLKNKTAYDSYLPTSMLGASNDFYNFILDSYSIFYNEDGVTLKAAWEMYKTYCDDAKVNFPFSQRIFKEELKNYFRDYKERYILADGTRARSFYEGFRGDIFDGCDVGGVGDDEQEQITQAYVIDFAVRKRSIFDSEFSDCEAQYATENGVPTKPWDDVKTKLSDLDTKKIHYVRLPQNHIVIDFDIPGPDGNKSFEKNLEEASKWPPTYAELSKSGAGIHLHYIYTGDPNTLSSIYSEHVEVKTSVGKSSLRRKLTKCNDLPISTISSGLPIKGDSKVINFETVKSEKALRSFIKRNLRKEIHANTKPSIDFIHKKLEDAYASGLEYDVSDMETAIMAFAVNSTNQAKECVKIVSKMKLKSEEDLPKSEVALSNIGSDRDIVFYDVEVFPNLFLICWKLQGEGQPLVRMVNPSPKQIEDLLRFRLIGFNCRRYDNHILYGRLIGMSNAELYKLSQKIINGEANCFFREAYNISYTDIYDFSSKKQSLKKFEIELGIRHKELGLPWDQPVPESTWMKVADYCDNDVIATEATFNARKEDYIARLALAKLSGLTPNNTTQQHTARIVFGNVKKPQDKFVYTDLSKMFPGYEFKNGASTYRGEAVSEGGQVYAEPGIYYDVALLDIASMHPRSAIELNVFGIYTKRFEELVEGRLAVKHGDKEALASLLGGTLLQFLKENPDISENDLAYALKIAINIVYGLTSAKFENPFKDPRNVDNIVAKRGALFMVDLKHAVQERGFTVAHIKTDSIKIPNATPEIIEFVMDFGSKYGYTFEHEATYEKMCLVNDAVYIAKYKDGKHAGEWTATGKQFAVPFIFKKLFSKEPIEFDDLCETKAVTSSLYLDMNEDTIQGDEAKLLKRLDQLGELMSQSLWQDDDSPEYLSPHEYEKLQNEYNDISAIINASHDYQFVGKVGRFCPILPGKGGGLLLREKDGKYHSATGAKGYRWLEAEMVKQLGKEEDIDFSYYNAMVDEAKQAISQYGDIEMFIH